MNTVIAQTTRAALYACASIALLAPLATQAEDNSVKRRLDAAGHKYSVDKDGDFKITFSFDDNRSQMVLVTGQPYVIADGVAVREIYSGVAKDPDDNIAGRAADFLKENQTKKIGAYEAQGGLVAFNVKLPDSASAAQLSAAIKMVAVTADEKEKAISGSRDTF